MKKRKIIVDGNEAAAQIAYKVSEVCAIYPITPASAMGELADLWASQDEKNIWGDVPHIIEMQSEGGAAGAVHGSLQGGALTTTFTASQGLLLMLPNMFKIAGELTPTVFHIAARSIATHALSIFGDHSDVMTARTTGFAMLFSSSVQEAMDLALISHAATLKSRIPFLHIFDGFRTSHELKLIESVTDEVIAKMVDETAIQSFKDRALNPNNPFIRGTAMNPDVFFQNREASNLYYNKLPGIVADTMKQFKELTGRAYHLFDYHGAADADRIVVIMGSGVGAVHETVDYLNAKGEKTGYIVIRLFRPFSIEDFVESVPTTVKSVAVLDRTKEPGGTGEPLYQDVVNAFVEKRTNGSVPTMIGGRYGLSSKEFTPAMVIAVFDELKKDKPKNHFTIGIKDDVSNTSLDFDKNFSLEAHTFSGLFYGLGADGTVSANKNSIKIIGEETDNHVQGYFVYDSKKAGALTISHLRFDDHSIKSTYLIKEADFVACHQFNFLLKYDILKNAKPGATFLLNAPYSAEKVWDKLPHKVQEDIIEKKLNFYVIDATRVARELKLGKRINTILQSCFFAISEILPREEAIEKIKNAINKSYSSKGEAVVQKNYAAVDQALDNLQQVKYESNADSQIQQQPAVPDDAPEFVRKVLAKILVGEGDELPVSSFPVDGTFPSATTQWEKRSIAEIVPEWDEELCTQCNKCLLICPHAAIRAKVVEKSALADAPTNYKTAPPVGKEFDKESEAYTLQVAVQDCTGCNLCVEICPAVSKTKEDYKALNMIDQEAACDVGIPNWDYFLSLPELDRSRVNKSSVKGSQFLQPLFEFSGACSGCGETPYLKLLTQLYGDNMIVANATGCSSIYGGNLPTTPWSVNHSGKGPAWANSLFEDNAEFGLGIKLAANKRRQDALSRLNDLSTSLGKDLVSTISNADVNTEEGLEALREQISLLKKELANNKDERAKDLLSRADDIIDKQVWIVGGDGWAYDIGYGGLDHVLASGENVNILVMDTEVYSNTGGQTSKATPPGASAKFSISGKTTAKKDLALHAIAYGNVYVAQIAMGAKDMQTVRALNEAATYPGPSITIAYAHCIEHGIDMSKGLSHQAKAVKSGYWPLFRFNPQMEKGKRFILDSKEPAIPLTDYIYEEVRYTRIVKENKEHAAKLLLLAEADVAKKWERIEAMRHL